MVNELKKCKFCGEEILQVAVKCKHCGSDLNEIRRPQIKQDNGEILGIFLLIIPIIAALLMWFWIGGMNLLQSPGSKLNFIAIGVLILTGIIAAIEANQLGFGLNKTKSRKMSETGPLGYFFGFVLLWIIVYPLYLYKRSTKGKKNLIFGGIIVALILIISYAYLQNEIDDRVSEINNALSSNQNQIIDDKSGTPLLDENKLIRTLGDMKSIGTGIEMYRTAVGFLPNGSGTAEDLFARISALAIITGNQRAIKDGWGNDFLIISNPDADSYAIGSPGKDGVFKGWDQAGPLLSESDYDQDIIYSNGTYVSDPAKQIQKELYIKKQINKNLITIKGTLYLAGETCFLSDDKGDIYLRNIDKILDKINSKNMFSKPVVINGAEIYKDEHGSIYYDVSSPAVVILLEKPIKSWEGILEGKFEAEDSIYLVTKNDSFYVTITGHSDKKAILEKIYQFADSQTTIKFEGLIEEYSNGNKFININKF